jgi:hypothetical protein
MIGLRTPKQRDLMELADGVSVSSPIEGNYSKGQRLCGESVQRKFQ